MQGNNIDMIQGAVVQASMGAAACASAAWLLQGPIGILSGGAFGATYYSIHPLRSRFLEVELEFKSPRNIILAAMAALVSLTFAWGLVATAGIPLTLSQATILAVMSVGTNKVISQFLQFIGASDLIRKHNLGQI